MRTLADEPDEGDELLDEREATKERRGRISDFVNKTRLKLATKTRQEKRKLNCAEEELPTKAKTNRVNEQNWPWNEPWKILNTQLLNSIALDCSKNFYDQRQNQVFILTIIYCCILEIFITKVNIYKIYEILHLQDRFKTKVNRHFEQIMKWFHLQAHFITKANRYNILAEIMKWWEKTLKMHITDDISFI